MSTLVQQHQQTTFRFYPTDHLIAIVDSPVRAEAALRDLLGAGFPPASIVTWYGPPGAALIDPAGATHGPTASSAAVWRSKSCPRSPRHVSRTPDGCHDK
jgi:hypothetical protein